MSVSSVAVGLGWIIAFVALILLAMQLPEGTAPHHAGSGQTSPTAPR